MSFNNQKLLKGQNHNVGEAEDRISELPDSLLHYILSFLRENTKCVAQTSILSKRWNNIWTSIPTLYFPSWNHFTSLSEINKFMDFVYRTLLSHHSSNIQKISLYTNEHFNATRVHSWISIITRCNVEELTLHLKLSEPFFVPVSLFTCETLTKLVLRAPFTTIHIPKSFSLPKLKSLTFEGIQFTDDCSWNQQTLSDCSVLENLNLTNCTWFGVRNFCISTPALKFLGILNYLPGNGLHNCDLKICAPSLVSLIYNGTVAKDYDLSSFVTLDCAEVYFNVYDGTAEQWLCYVAAAKKFFRALSHVKSLKTDAASLKVLSGKDDYINNLPTFHNLNKLDLFQGRVTYKLIFPLLKAAPNLNGLRFDDCTRLSIDDEKEYDETEGLFRHLQSVYFGEFMGERKDLRLAQLILRNAESLQMMTISFGYLAKNKDMVISELSRSPRASRRCVFEVV